MPESSRTPTSSFREDEVIVIDDDDDVDMATAQPEPAQSPLGSLANLTPAASIATTSNGSASISGADHPPNGAPASSSSLDVYRTGYVFTTEMMLHVNPLDPEHPEKPVRIWKIHERLRQNVLIRYMKRIRIREVTKDEVMLVHDAGIWDGVEQSALYRPDLLKEQVPMLESASSLYVNEHSAYAARLSCGGAIELCDAIASGRIRNGFAIIRPPGHHAEPHKSMGFCFYNNVAVATRYLQRKYPQKIQKILILDWDVHHGNGTQRAFESDKEVLYISLHRYDEDGSFYPGSTYGNYDSAGTGPGLGRSVNVPWPTHGMGDADYMYAFHHLVMPIAHEFSPDFVIISAGFDAAEGDPIGLNRVTPGGYAQMTHALTSLCEGKVAVILEGGYNPDAVADSALAVTNVILSRETAEPRDTVASTIAAATVQQVCRFQSKFWKSIKVPDLDANDVDFDSGSAPPSAQIGALLAAYRNEEIARKHGLFEVPLNETSHKRYGGHIFCSPDILSNYSTIVFFVHDMGNLRWDRRPLHDKLEKEALRLVDSSSLIIDYAASRGYGIVDMNILSEFNATTPVKSSALYELDRLDQACEVAAFIWDNVVALARTSKESKRVVMIGLGTGCNVLTSLMKERDWVTTVEAVVNIVGYGDMPSLPVNTDLTAKKRYYKTSQVFAPVDHPHLLERGDAAPLKRFGRITPVSEVSAIKILSHHIHDITSFIDKKLRAK